MKETRALGATFGAEVLDFLISSSASTEEITAIKTLWAEHKLLLFRNQTLDESTLVSFSQVFGALEIHVRTEYLSPDHPEILYVSNIQKNGQKVGILADTEVGWHYDQIYLPRPAVGSLLMAHTLPPEGGNTEFADMTAAYEELPESVKTRLHSAHAVQSYEAFNRAYSVPTNKEQKKKSPDIEHPIVRTHPITGRKALYLCPGMTTEIVGWDPAESREMLDYLFEWSIQPRYVYSHAWQPGDALLWDNACTMHRRDPFDQNHERLMKRTTILPPQELAVPV
ncbi:MAG: TauD/TfdA family dioxygenase [Luminiphilus sp.]|nr:TauD/TfdA family dioxygenase [Luminiphilus sp.]